MPLSKICHCLHMPLSIICYCLHMPLSIICHCLYMLLSIICHCLYMPLSIICHCLYMPLSIYAIVFICRCLSSVLSCCCCCPLCCQVVLRDSNERLQHKLEHLKTSFGSLAVSKTDLSAQLLLTEEEKLKVLSST